MGEVTGVSLGYELNHEAVKIVFTDFMVIGSVDASGARGGLGARLGVLCPLGEHLERLRMVQRQVGEALAIQSDAGGLQAVDQLTVGQAVQARGGVDAHDPQAAEVALLAAAAGVGVVQRLVDGLLGGLIQLALGGVEPLRALQQLLRLARRTVPRLTRGMVTDSFRSDRCNWITGNG